MHYVGVISTILLTLGALNSVLALKVGTCTQGDAGNLYGGFLTLLLYVAGFIALTIRPPSRWAWVSLLPAAAVAMWHTLFAAYFMWGYWAKGMSACYAMKGGFTADKAGEWMDGGEPLLTALWASASAVFWMAIAAAVRSRRGTLTSAES